VGNRVPVILRGKCKPMSARAQVIINLPNLRKVLMEDMAWVSDNCPKQTHISITGHGLSSTGRGPQESTTLQFI